MKTKVLALTITFTAVTIFLNPRFSGLAIPSFVPRLWFQFWEIPVFAAFLLFGLKPSILISVLNTFILLLISPGVPFNEPIANLLAVLSTLLGMWLAEGLIIRAKNNRKLATSLKGVFFSTIFGIIIRLVVMIPYIFANALLFGTLMIIMPLLPLVVVYDTIVVLYSVPIAYVIVKAVHHQLKLDIGT